MMQLASGMCIGKRDGMTQRMDRFGLGKGGRCGDTVCGRHKRRNNVVMDLTQT